MSDEKVVPEGHEEICASGIGWYCSHQRCLWPETGHFDSLKTAMEYFKDEQKVAFMELEHQLKKSIEDIYDSRNPSVESFVNFAVLSSEYINIMKQKGLEVLVKEVLSKE